MSVASGGPPASSLPPPALDDLLDALDHFDPRTCARGRAYAEGGRVGTITIDAGSLSATVRGTEQYDVAWEHDHETWFPSCTCPVDTYCKHAYAVAWLVLSGTGTAAVRIVRERSNPARRALARLRDATQPWERQHALTQLLALCPVAVDPYGFGLHEILAESDPDLRCWWLAREVVARANGWLPGALEPFRDRPDLGARAAERARADLARDLMAWAGRRRTRAERRLRLVFGLKAGVAGRARLTVEARLTTARLADARRSAAQLQQLRAELRSDPDALPPTQAALLVALTDYRSGADQYLLQGDFGLPSRSLLDLVAADSSLAAWDSDLPDDLARRGGIEPGAAVRLSITAANLLPVCVSRDGEAWLELQFVWPDGRSRRLDEVVHLRGSEHVEAGSSLVLADGAFSVVIAEPPAGLAERFAVAGGLPLGADRGGILGILASSFPQLRETLAAHTRFHPVTACAALDLREDDWLQIRLFARAARDWRPGRPIEAQQSVFEYTPEQGWTAVTGVTAAAASEAIAEPSEAPQPVPLPVPAEIWADAPAPEVVEPAIAWLATTGTAPGTRRGAGAQEPPWEDRATGWWMRLGRRRTEALGDAWERRPPQLAFFGNERVRRLLGGGSRLVPRLRIESSGVDWLTVSADWEAEGIALSDEEMAALRRATTRFVRLPSGWVDRGAVVERHDDTSRVLAELGIEAGEGAQRLTLWQLAGAKPQSLEHLERLGLDPATAAAVHTLRQRVARFAGLPRVRLPRGLTATLRPYQRDGLDFLAWTASLGVGAILADDMGLGKTVQTLAWLAHLRAADAEGGPSLVVAPTSVVRNWEREAARFVPAMRVLLLERGPGRHALRREIERYDLVVTNYALLRRDAEAWREVPLRAAILDEAQNVKNPDAVVTHAALALQARHRLALTGTPLENRALDLWSLMSFVNPGYLGNRARFTARYDRLDASPHARTLLAAKLRPVLLRRLKSDVARDLPPRIEERRDCELTAGQRRLYLAELRRSRALVEHLSDEPGGVGRHRIDILAALTRLRQICCHPALAGGKPALGSGKFEALFELLEPLRAEGHKVVVFSQFVECLKRLAIELRARELPFHMLTGETVKRDRVVDGFGADERPAVFLVSLRAGGSGLNLTAASYVVLFDPWWNPAVEAQAIDRTHRIGQERTVIAYRLLARGTIEEKIWALQQRKAALVRDVLGEGGFGRALTREDLDYLLADDA